MTCPSRVLLIDDDIDDIQIFCMVLRDLYPGIEILTEFESELALTHLKQGKLSKPDFIFLDLNMPKIDGWQCLSAIKKMPVYKDTPIVMYSTSNDPQEKQIALHKGASYFLTKLHTVAQIRRSLSEFFTSKLQHN